MIMNNLENGNVGKWEDGKMGMWKRGKVENGNVGKWEGGKIGRRKMGMWERRKVEKWKGGKVGEEEIRKQEMGMFKQAVWRRRTERFDVAEKMRRDESFGQGNRGRMRMELAEINVRTQTKYCQCLPAFLPGRNCVNRPAMILRIPCISFVLRFSVKWKHIVNVWRNRESRKHLSEISSVSSNSEY